MIILLFLIVIGFILAVIFMGLLVLAPTLTLLQQIIALASFILFLVIGSVSLTIVIAKQANNPQSPDYRHDFDDL